jgi:hypothetical protein
MSNEGSVKELKNTRKTKELKNLEENLREIGQQYLNDYKVSLDNFSDKQIELLTAGTIENFTENFLTIIRSSKDLEYLDWNEVNHKNILKNIAEEYYAQKVKLIESKQKALKRRVIKVGPEQTQINWKDVHEEFSLFGNPLVEQNEKGDLHFIDLDEDIKMRIKSLFELKYPEHELTEGEINKIYGQAKKLFVHREQKRKEVEENKRGYDKSRALVPINNSSKEVISLVLPGDKLVVDNQDSGYTDTMQGEPNNGQPNNINSETQTGKKTSASRPSIAQGVKTLRKMEKEEKIRSKIRKKLGSAEPGQNNGNTTANGNIVNINTYPMHGYAGSPTGNFQNGNFVPTQPDSKNSELLAELQKLKDENAKLKGKEGGETNEDRETKKKKEQEEKEAITSLFNKWSSEFSTIVRKSIETEKNKIDPSLSGDKKVKAEISILENEIKSLGKHGKVGGKFSVEFLKEFGLQNDVEYSVLEKHIKLVATPHKELIDGIRKQLTEEVEELKKLTDNQAGESSRGEGDDRDNESEEKPLSTGLPTADAVKVKEEIASLNKQLKDAKPGFWGRLFGRKGNIEKIKEIQSKINKLESQLKNRTASKDYLALEEQHSNLTHQINTLPKRSFKRGDLENERTKVQRQMKKSGKVERKETRAKDRNERMKKRLDEAESKTMIKRWFGEMTAHARNPEEWKKGENYRRVAGKLALTAGLVAIGVLGGTAGAMLYGGFIAKSMGAGFAGGATRSIYTDWKKGNVPTGKIFSKALTRGFCGAGIAGIGGAAFVHIAPQAAAYIDTLIPDSLKEWWTDIKHISANIPENASHLMQTTGATFETLKNEASNIIDSIQNYFSSNGLDSSAAHVSVNTADASKQVAVGLNAIKDQLQEINGYIKTGGVDPDYLNSLKEGLSLQYDKLNEVMSGASKELTKGLDSIGDSVKNFLDSLPSQPNSLQITPDVPSVETIIPQTPDFYQVSSLGTEIVNGNDSVWSILQDRLEMGNPAILESINTHGKQIADEILNMIRDQADTINVGPQKLAKLTEWAAKLPEVNITGSEMFWKKIPDGLEIDLDKINEIIYGRIV